MARDRNVSVLDWSTGVSVYKPEKCYNGYTVVTPYHSELIFLVDMLGRVVHVWHSDPERIARAWFLRRLSSGNWLTMTEYVSRGGRGPAEKLSPDARDHARLTGVVTGGVQTGRPETQVLELTWDGSVAWRYAVGGGRHAHHDMARLANGNTLILTGEVIAKAEVSDKPFSDDVFIEVNHEGEIVWEWATRDHFAEFGYSEECLRLMREKGGDIFHTNTCSPLPANSLEKEDARFSRGNILSSQRNVNLIYILDKKSGEVVWTWGQDRGQLVGQHHPVMLANGNILIYDNGGQGGYPPVCRFYTRLVEVNPLSNEIVWEYAHEPHTFKPMSRFFSSSWGSVQRLPNGNTFSLDCHKGRLFEVTPYGEIVWEYVSPFSWGRGVGVVEAGMYRAYRYGYEDVPDVAPWFPGTDGHMGLCACEMQLPDGMGLPPADPV